MSQRYVEAGTAYQGEFYFLVLSSFVGMLLMPSSRDLLMLFLSLEIVSATGFIAAGFRKGDARGNEGALKFLLIGVLSTAVMLFGMSLVYGFTGSLQLTIAERLAELGDEPAVVMSVFLVITGFAFKVSAARSTSGLPTPTRAPRSRGRLPVGRLQGRRLRRAAQGGPSSPSRPTPATGRRPSRCWPPSPCCSAT